jgi:putative restriction endonuclease
MTGPVGGGALGPLTRKAAGDAGFDLEPILDGGWWRLAMSGMPGAVWVRPSAGTSAGASRDGACLAVPHPAELAELQSSSGPGLPVVSLAEVEGGVGAPLPPAAAGGVWCPSPRVLFDALRRIRVLRRSAQPSLESRIVAQMAHVGSTEALAEVRRRIGQDLFRDALFDYWGGACAATGLAVPELLRASHAKPWKDSNDAERLDVYNGLLLAVHLDALFDRGLLTFSDEGVGLLSPLMPAAGMAALGLAGVEIRLRHVQPGHRPYLQHHRNHVYRVG